MRRFDTALSLSIPSLAAAAPILSVAALVMGALGCRPSAPAEAPATPEATPAPAPADQPAAAAPVTKCSGELVAADDGLVEDFEDGNSQVSATAGRDGYWWIAKDDKGSEVKVPGTSFTPADGGASSAKAAHVAGKTVSGSDAWGAEFGANLVNGQGALYDASKYAGIKFKAKATGPTQSLRVSLSDVNTHQDAGVCKACWNHFRKDVTLSPEWKEYTVEFSELQQRQGWGDPRPATVTPQKLVGVSFAVEGGKEFDVWVDDVQFLVCKK